MDKLLFIHASRSDASGNEMPTDMKDLKGGELRTRKGNRAVSLYDGMR